MSGVRFASMSGVCAAVLTLLSAGRDSAIAAIVQANGSYLVDVSVASGASEHLIVVYDSTLKFRVVY